MRNSKLGLNYTITGLTNDITPLVKLTDKGIWKEKKQAGIYFSYYLGIQLLALKEISTLILSSKILRISVMRRLPNVV